MNLLLRLLFVLGALLPAQALAAGGVTLSFTFFYGETKIADVTDTLLLSEDGDTYRLQSSAAAVGLAKMLHGDSLLQSSGAVDAAEGLLMTLYTEQRGRRKPQRAELAGDQLQLRRGEEMRTETVTAPVFDYLSAAYRSYILGRAAGGMLTFTNGWRLREYEYQIHGTETVMTGLGEMEAILIVRESPRGARKMWLAPALGYLPARLFVSDKGHEFTTVLEAVNKP